MLRIIIPLPSQGDDISTTESPDLDRSSAMLLSEIKLSLLITLVGMVTISKGMKENVSAIKVEAQSGTVWSRVLNICAISMACLALTHFFSS